MFSAMKDLRILNLSAIFKLDLDFQTMKTNILQGNRNQMEWLQTQLERNKSTRKQLE